MSLHKLQRTHLVVVYLSLLALGILLEIEQLPQATPDALNSHLPVGSPRPLRFFRKNGRLDQTAVRITPKSVSEPGIDFDFSHGMNYVSGSDKPVNLYSNMDGVGATEYAAPDTYGVGATEYAGADTHGVGATEYAGADTYGVGATEYAGADTYGVGATEYAGADTYGVGATEYAGADTYGVGATEYAGADTYGVGATEYAGADTYGGTYDSQFVTDGSVQTDNQDTRHHNRHRVNTIIRAIKVYEELNAFGELADLLTSIIAHCSAVDALSRRKPAPGGSWHRCYIHSVNECGRNARGSKNKRLGKRCLRHARSGYEVDNTNMDPSETDTNEVVDAQTVVKNVTKTRLIKANPIKNVTKTHLIKANPIKNVTKTQLIKANPIKNVTKTHLIKANPIKNVTKTHLIKANPIKNVTKTHLIKANPIKNVTKTRLIKAIPIKNVTKTHLIKANPIKNVTKTRLIKANPIKNVTKTHLIKANPIKNVTKTRLIKANPIKKVTKTHLIKANPIKNVTKTQLIKANPIKKSLRTRQAGSTNGKGVENYQTVTVNAHYTFLDDLNALNLHPRLRLDTKFDLAGLDSLHKYEIVKKLVQELRWVLSRRGYLLGRSSTDGVDLLQYLQQEGLQRPLHVLTLWHLHR